MGPLLYPVETINKDGVSKMKSIFGWRRFYFILFLDRSSKTTHFVGFSQLGFLLLGIFQNLDFLKVKKSCRFQKRGNLDFLKVEKKLQISKAWQFGFLNFEKNVFC